MRPQDKINVIMDLAGHAATRSMTTADTTGNLVEETDEVAYWFAYLMIMSGAICTQITKRSQVANHLPRGQAMAMWSQLAAGMADGESVNALQHLDDKFAAALLRRMRNEVL